MKRLVAATVLVMVSTASCSSIRPSPIPALPSVSRVSAIVFSTHADRSAELPLDGRTLASARVYVFFRPPAVAVRSVSYYLDDPGMVSSPWSTATAAPYDLDGHTDKGPAVEFDLGSLADSAHTITAAVRTVDGRLTVSRARFTVAAPRGTRPFRRLILDDEFSGGTLDTTRWQPFSGKGNRGNGTRSPSAISLDGHGNLVITASTQHGRLVAGGISSSQSFVYGQVEFRVRTEPDPAGETSGVVLLWPPSELVADGEEDLYETLSQPTRSRFYSFLHSVGRPAKQDHLIHRVPATQWHTIAAVWSPSAITIYRDGLLVWRDHRAAVIPTTPHAIHIQLDATASRALREPVRLYVDYVRVYQ